jgi:hypothetical protein
MHVLQLALVETEGLVVLGLTLPWPDLGMHLNYNLTSSLGDQKAAWRILVEPRADGLALPGHILHSLLAGDGASPSVLSALVLCENEESLSITGKRSNLAAIALIFEYSCSVLAVLIEPCISMSLLAISGFSTSILTSIRLLL